MKKKIFVIVCLMAISGIANAKWEFGARAGGSLSSFSTSNTSYSGGYYLGGYVGYAFIPRLYLTSGVDFSMQGIKYDGNSNFNHKFTQDLYYLQVPVLLHVKLFLGLSAELGPQFGFLLSNSSSVKDITVSNIDYNVFDCGLAMGVGYKLPIIPIKLQFRYVRGFTDVSSSSISGLDFSSAKNNSFQFGLALEF